MVARVGSNERMPCRDIRERKVNSQVAKLVKLQEEIIAQPTIPPYPSPVVRRPASSPVHRRQRLSDPHQYKRSYSANRLSSRIFSVYERMLWQS